MTLELPQATRVFEKLRIDYCCGGERSLTEACTSAGLETAAVMRMLEEAERADVGGNIALEFHKLTLTELIAHIIDKHHVYTKEEIARLELLIDKVIGAHGANHSELHGMGELIQQLSADLRPHMFKEEQILFPYIVEMERAAQQNNLAPFAPFGTVNNPVRMMMMEHDTVGDILRELRQTSSNYAVPADGCISYQILYQALEAFETDLHQHIHLENNILFPRAIELEERLTAQASRCL